jgi:thiol-disulfide isomerase/thioredoxin
MSVDPSPRPARWNSLGRKAALLAVLAVVAERSVEWIVGQVLEGWQTTAKKQEVNARYLTLSSRGQLIYQVHCLRCHGPEGRGDGSDSIAFRPPPRNLLIAIGSWSNERVRQSIVEGKKGTPMPAFGQTFSDRELNALVAHLRSFRYVSDLEVSERNRALLTERLQRAKFVPESKRRPAPRLTYRDASGRTATLDEHRGRVVLVAFWGATCGPCLKELPDLERLADRYRESGLIVLPVCVDPTDPAEASAVASSRVQHLPVYADVEGSVRLGYDVQTLPTTALIDRSGRLIGLAQGSRAWDGLEVQELIAACLAQP